MTVKYLPHYYLSFMKIQRNMKIICHFLLRTRLVYLYDFARVCEQIKFQQRICLNTTFKFDTSIFSKSKFYIAGNICAYSL